MAILSPNMDKKDVFAFVKKIQNGDKNSKLEWYTYMGEQIANVSLTDSIHTTTADHVASTLSGVESETEKQGNSSSSVLATVFGELPLSRDELVAIRDILVAPFVSDVYSGGSEEGNDEIDVIIHSLLAQNNDILFTRLATLTQEIENILKKFPVDA